MYLIFRYTNLLKISLCETNKVSKMFNGYNVDWEMYVRCISKLQTTRVVIIIIIISQSAAFYEIIQNTWHYGMFLVFNCLVVDFPKDQQDLTISIFRYLLFSVLTCIDHCSFLAAVLAFTGWAKKVIPLVHYITLYERYHVFWPILYAFMFCELLCFFYCFILRLRVVDE